MELKQIINNNKRGSLEYQSAEIIFYNSMKQNYVCPFFVFQKDMLDNWLNLDDPSKLINVAKHKLKEEGFNKDKIVVTQMVLTAKPNFKNILQWIFCCKSANVNHVTGK